MRASIIHIASTSLLGLFALRAPETEAGSGQPAPGSLPGSINVTVAKTLPDGTVVKSPATPAGSPPAVAKTPRILEDQRRQKAEDRKPTPIKAASTAKKVAASTAPKKRASRIAPLMDKVVASLKQSAKTVAVLAEKLAGGNERDIRLAIDRARARGEKIERLSKNTFGYAQKKTVPARKPALPKAA